MNKIFLQKCEEVFSQKNTITVSSEQISCLKLFLGRDLSEEYIYLLTNYSMVFLKDNFEICSKYNSRMADENGAEPFMYFAGLEGKDNIFSVYDMYKNQLPSNYFPIALADGGNLLCVDNCSEAVYLWIHDKIDDVCKIFDSIEQMILQTKEIDNSDKYDDLGVKDIWFSDELFEAVKALKSKK